MENKEIKLKKEVFVASIKAIQYQIEKDIEMSEKLAEVFNADSTNFLPDNNLLIDAMMLLLQEQMNDTEKGEDGRSWIEWFCYDVDFGKESYRLKAYDENKNIIKMDNASDLYDYLINKNI